MDSSMDGKSLSISTEAPVEGDSTSFAENRLEKLLVTARDGNELAFEELMRLFLGEVYRIALTLLGQPDQASDVSQDVFLRMYKSLGRLNSSKGLRAWLRRVTVNRCYDILRGRRRSLDIEQALTPGCMQVADSMSSTQLAHLLQQVLDILSPRERAAMMLTCQLGMSSTEAGQAMACRPSTVRALTFKARDKIRSLLTQNDDDWSVT
jgi:RNA polymerase sigma-70 factor (ECF subfamily)